jgi:hypothetical protein
LVRLAEAVDRKQASKKDFTTEAQRHEDVDLNPVFADVYSNVAVLS